MSLTYNMLYLFPTTISLLPDLLQFCNRILVSYQDANFLKILLPVSFYRSGLKATSAHFPVKQIEDDYFLNHTPPLTEQPKNEIQPCISKKLVGVLFSTVFCALRGT